MQSLPQLISLFSAYGKPSSDVHGSGQAVSQGGTQQLLFLNCELVMDRPDDY